MRPKAQEPIAFDAAIVDIHIKRLVSQDKSLRVTLEVDYPTDELVNDLNRMFKADKDVAVGLAETKKI